MRSRTDIFEEANRKRGHPEPTDGLDQAKRQRLGAAAPIPTNKVPIPPLTPGPHSIAELFTITTDEGLKTFDVGQLSQDLVVRIGISILAKLDTNTFNQAINVSLILCHLYMVVSLTWSPGNSSTIPFPCNSATSPRTLEP
jgi:symplekin